MKRRLLDNWSESGNDLAQFKTLLKEMSSITRTKKVEANQVQLYSKNEHILSTADKVPVYVLDPGNPWDIDATTGVFKGLKQGALNRKTFDAAGAQDLVQEYENKTKLLLNVDGHVYFTSTNLSPTLGLRTEMKGEAACEPTLARDVLTAQRLGTNEEITFVTRIADGLRKVYAAMSGTYAYVPQSFLCDVIDRVESDATLGAVSCKHWSINNQLAEVYLEFPDKAAEIAAVYEYGDEIVPGLYLAKSDVGECSITIRATWRINNSLIIADELKRKHTGKIKIEDILEDVDKTVFSKYTKVPELLCELMATDITNPAWTKLSEKKFLAMNEKAIAEAFKTVFKEIGVVGAIGKKNEKEVYEQLCAEIDASLAYTAYDIVMAVMQLPERLSGLSTSYKELLAKACGKAPFVKFDTTKPKSKVVLTA